MKKSTLISTLAMVVIVALALTTATFAWYTANSNVTATSSATAAVASSANLAIGADANAKDTTYPITSVGTEMLPAAPAANWSADGSAPASASDAADALMTAITTVDGHFSANGTKATTMSGTFYVINLSKDGSITPKVTLTATAKVTADPDAEDADAEAARVAALDGSNLLRVALFVDGEYKGTLSNATSADTVFGTIAKDDAASDLETYTANNTITLAAIAGGSNIKVEIVAWFDGAGLNTAKQGASCDFTLTFSDSAAA